MANALINGTPTAFYIEEITDEYDDADTAGGCGDPDDDHARRRPSPAETSVWTTLKIDPFGGGGGAVGGGGGATLTLLDGRLYAFGGCSRAGTSSSALRCFDIGSNTWLDEQAHCNGATCSSIKPSPRFGHTTVAYGSKLYLFGGQGPDSVPHGASSAGNCTTCTSTPSSFDTSPPVSFNDLYVLDVGVDNSNNCTAPPTWTLIDGGTTPNESAHDYYNQTHRPMPRNSHTATILGGKMYVFGGANEEVGVMNDLWMLDLDLDHHRGWERIIARGVVDGSVTEGAEDGGVSTRPSAIPDAREMHAACAIPLDKSGTTMGLLIVGGRRADGTACNDTWIFSPQTKLWKQIGSGSLDRPRCSHTAVFVPEHNVVAVFGGWDCCGTIFDDLICFDVETERWTNVDFQLSTSVAERFAHTACEDGNGTGVYICGGVNAQADLNDLIHLEANK